MTGEGLNRKLAAILYADVAGYSRLTGDDEEGTHRQLSAHLDAVSAVIEGHGGRVLHFAGDAVLAEFASAVTAVACAVDVQRDLATRNENLVEDRRVRFRIGVNLGDVIVDRDELYGDSVNVAARLEALAEPGGICISRKVLDEVGGKLDVGYTFVGDKTVKNIDRPIPVYRVDLMPERSGRVIGDPRKRLAPSRNLTLAGFVVTVVVIVGAVTFWGPKSPEPPLDSVTGSAFPLPKKPSIAVLPFDNLSGDAGQEYIADGITDDIITTLSQVPGMFVIARNSTFTYKGRAVKVQDVAADLGVRYVLEGSVQKSGDVVRIHAQLIDTSDGNHLWAERYDRQLTDLFVLQDDITEHVVTALQIELTEGEQMRVRRRHTRNLEAWNLLTKGVEYFYRRTKDDNIEARRHFDDAIKADPGYALAWALIAWTHWFDAQFGWGAEPRESFEQARFMAEKARSLNEELPDVYSLLGAIELLRERYDDAVAAGEKAVALNPNHATNTALLAVFLHNAGRPRDAIRKMKRAMRLSPYYAAWFLEQLGFSYLDADEPDEALAALTEFLKREPTGLHAAHAHIGRAFAFHKLGRVETARAAVRDALDADPTISITQFRQDGMSGGVSNRETGFAILRELGLPE